MGFPPELHCVEHLSGAAFSRFSPRLTLGSDVTSEITSCFFEKFCSAQTHRSRNCQHIDKTIFSSLKQQGGNMTDFPVTQLLVDWRGGRETALDELMPVVYGELRRIAGHHMRREKLGHTLQPTAVVNEAYIRLVDANVDWNDRIHFYAVAARLMRRMLVDYARAKHREKRGGPATLLTLNEDLAGQSGAGVDVMDLDLAMRKLAETDERKSKVVELHYFGGLNYDETAAALGISAATVDRELRLAKAWLHREMGGAL
jgi:RNA polymerase sigma-70 factor (ECF subfamily)